MKVKDMQKAAFGYACRSLSVYDEMGNEYHAFQDDEDDE